MLLRMLEWPGPDKELTRYMEIERQDPKARRGKVNEYKDRPVLPDPLQVGGRRDLAASTKTAAQSQRPSSAGSPIAQKPASSALQQVADTSRTPVQPPLPTKLTTKTELALSHPASIDEVQEGMYLEGTVVRVESGRVVVDILGQEASLIKDHIEPPIRDDFDMEERFPVGKRIYVFVRGRNKQGRLQLTMRRTNK
jgi:hypothetical protein